MAKRYIQNPQDPSKYIEFDEGTTDEDIGEAMESLSSGASAAPAPALLPEVPANINMPIQPVPMTEMSGVQAAPTEGWRTEDILPVQREWKAENGLKKDTGNWDWAVPGMAQSAWDSITLPGEVMRGETDPMSEEGFDRTMGMAGMAVGGSPAIRSATKTALAPAVPIAKAAAAPVAPALKSVLSRVAPEPVKGAGFVEEAIKKIGRRKGGESIPKAQIIRQEAGNVYEDFGKYMTSAQKAAVQKIAEEPGYIRGTMESMAQRKPASMGFDSGTLTAATGMGFFQGPGAGFATMAARMGAGLLDKTLVAGSKLAQAGVNRSQIKQLRKAVPPSTKRRKRQPLDDKTNVPPVSYPPEKTPRQVKESMPRPKKEGPVAGSEAGIGALTRDPKNKIKPQGVQGPLAVPNPSGKIKMNIGEPIKKTTGTDPNFLRAQKIAKAEGERAQREAELSYRQGRKGAAQPAPPVVEPKPSKPKPKVETESERLMREYMGSGGTVTRPTPKKGRVLPKGSKEPARGPTIKQLDKADDFQTRLNDAKAELKQTDYIDSEPRRVREREAIQKRITHYENEIKSLKSGETAPKSVLSDATFKEIADTPPEYRSAQQNLDMAKKSLDDTKYIDHGGDRARERSRLKEDIAKLEQEVASQASPELKAAREAAKKHAAAEAEARKNAVKPESILARQAEEIKAKPKAPAKKAAARQARNEKKIKSFADIVPEVAKKVSDDTDTPAIAGIRKYMKEKNKGRRPG